ncbi:hypothetical protein HaLaN_32710 [Haematococcus lacustris]|uniref:Uncharacterized protein n=1 Tax=Haematococcus lacustris TaxID=44745 RepID=A0A6A0AKQ4_HAELA|nr:hypothetical protein HaLaN_32710 [Haematococcus lacustris]
MDPQLDTCLDSCLHSPVPCAVVTLTTTRHVEQSENTVESGASLTPSPPCTSFQRWEGAGTQGWHAGVLALPCCAAPPPPPPLPPPLAAVLGDEGSRCRAWPDQVAPPIRDMLRGCDAGGGRGRAGVGALASHPMAPIPPHASALLLCRGRR